jgi:predicted site-specific integrase-resolvase
VVVFRIPESEVRRIAEGLPISKEVRAVIYARVSSSEQKSDLERQVQYLTQYCSSKGYRVRRRIERCSERVEDR